MFAQPKRNWWQHDSSTKKSTLNDSQIWLQVKLQIPEDPTISVTRAGVHFVLPRHAAPRRFTRVASGKPRDTPDSRFTDEKAEAQRNVICPRSHRQQAWSQNLNSRVHDLSHSTLLLLSRKCLIKTPSPGFTNAAGFQREAAHFYLSEETFLGASQGRCPPSRNLTLNLGLHLFPLERGYPVEDLKLLD